MKTSTPVRNLASLCAAFALSACATAQAPAPAPAPAAAAAAAAPATAGVGEYYVVLPEDGRMYAFSTRDLYFQFLRDKEVAYTRTRIGMSPMGTTLVFGITSDDVKKNAPSPAEQLFDGKVQAVSPFYGEVLKSGRYYVFGDYKVMKDFVATGEIPYSFTDIGTGPDGATMVWVVDSAGFKQGRPQVTIDRFAALRKAK